MREETVQLTLTVGGGEGSDARELDQLTVQLRQRLLELDVDSVRPVRDEEVPPGARSAEAVTAGALLITLGPPALHSVVGLVERLVERWMDSRQVASVTLAVEGDVITLDSAALQEPERVLTPFVARHAQE